MIISYSHQFIFVHVPKTAGLSIDGALRPYAQNLPQTWADRFFGRLRLRDSYFKYHPYKRFRRHATAEQIRRHLPRETYETFYKFAFVRNPWDWMVSYYHYLLEKADHHRHRLVRRLRGFEEYLEYEIRRNKAGQTQFLRDAAGQMLVDFVGRFESLEADFAQVCSRLGLVARLPRMNRSRHNDYRTYYNARTIELVARHFRAEIELFGYTFDGVAWRQVS